MSDENKIKATTILKKIERNGTIILDVIKAVESGTDPIDHEMAVRVINLYIENETLYQDYIDLLKASDCYH